MIGVDLDNISIHDANVNQPETETVVEPPSQSEPQPTAVEPQPEPETVVEPTSQTEPQPTVVEPEPEPQPTVVEPEPEPVVQPEPEDISDIEPKLAPYMKVYADDPGAEPLQRIDKDHPIKMEVVVPASSIPPKPLPPPPQQNRTSGLRMKMRF